MKKVPLHIVLGTNSNRDIFNTVKRDKKYIFENSILKSTNRINEVFVEKGIKQKWLAEKLGKSNNMVNGMCKIDSNLNLKFYLK